MNSGVILFIVEGENRDFRYVNAMTRCFMRGRFRATVVCLPAAQNVYMLYKKLEEDNFETDIVEVLRESVPSAREELEGIMRREISEVFMFFDFDPHQDNLENDGLDAFEVMEKMLCAFDNETENGKLYISYPMVEALCDYRLGQCQAFSRCFISIDEIGNYKKVAGEGNPVSSIHMQFEDWSTVIEVFVLRVRCLLDLQALDFEGYRKSVSPLDIYKAEWQLCAREQKVFVLSAFPEFLLDYFNQDFWNSRVKLVKHRFNECPIILH